MSDPCEMCGCRGCILIRHDDSVEVCCSGCGQTVLDVADEYLKEAET